MSGCGVDIGTSRDASTEKPEGQGRIEIAIGEATGSASHVYHISLTYRF